MPDTPGTASKDPVTVRVLGVQRTGSSWLRGLVRRNVLADDLNVGRLHRPVEPSSADAFLVIMRDPWAWLPSFYDFQLHPVFGFIDRLWNKLLHPPVDRWRAFRWWNYYLLAYERWQETLPPDRMEWVHYLELLPDPAPRFADVLDALGLPCKDPIERDTRYRKDFSSPLAKLFSPETLRSSSFDPTYYTEKRYLDRYRPSHQHELYKMATRQGLATRFERFGYDLEEDLQEP